MKRSLTIGCVLLVGGGVANCGGVVSGTSPEPDSGAHAGSSGSLNIAGGFVGTIAQGGSVYVGVAVETGGTPNYGGGGGYFIGDAVGSERETDAGAPDIVSAGASNWDMGGESGTSNEPPAVGTAPLGGAGGWVGTVPLGGSGGAFGVPPESGSAGD